MRLKHINESHIRRKIKKKPANPKVNKTVRTAFSANGEKARPNQAPVVTAVPSV
jgi:hypothetical protein